MFLTSGAIKVTELLPVFISMRVYTSHNCNAQKEQNYSAGLVATTNEWPLSRN